MLLVKFLNLWDCEGVGEGVLPLRGPGCTITIALLSGWFLPTKGEWFSLLIFVFFFWLYIQCLTFDRLHSTFIIDHIVSSVLIVEGSSVHVEPCSELQYYEYHDCELLMLSKMLFLPSVSDPVSDGPDSGLAENPPEKSIFCSGFRLVSRFNSS